MSVPAFMSIQGGGLLGLVHQPVVREFASFESRRAGLKERGGKVGGGALRLDSLGGLVP